MKRVVNVSFLKSFFVVEFDFHKWLSKNDFRNTILSFRKIISRIKYCISKIVFLKSFFYIQEFIFGKLKIALTDDIYT